MWSFVLFFLPIVPTLFVTGMHAGAFTAAIALNGTALIAVLTMLVTGIIKTYKDPEKYHHSLAAIITIFIVGTHVVFAAMLISKYMD